jgi:DNA-binding NtrC family response regulator
VANTNRIVVTGEPRLAEAIVARVRTVLGAAAVFCPLATARDLGSDGGVFIATAATRAEGDAVALLVQEAHLRRWPSTILVIQAETREPGKDLSSLDRYTAGRFSWPNQAQSLLDEVRRRWPSGSYVEESFWASSADRIRRQLRQTPTLLPLAEDLARAAAREGALLLTGESGAGKTYLARLIHEASPRRGQPFLVVPCGTLGPDLVASELFGRASADHSGQPTAGKLDCAGSGTVLLDEIDALLPDQQAAVLRLLETGDYEPVGSHQPRHSAARIIASSSRNLEEAVRKGSFHAALYYRLKVMSVRLPPLRERVPDIGPLARHLAAEFNASFRKGLFEIHAGTLATLEAFPWPGNIRQLANAIQQAVLRSRGTELRPEHLPQAVRVHVGLTGNSPCRSLNALL